MFSSNKHIHIFCRLNLHKFLRSLHQLILFFFNIHHVNVKGLWKRAHRYHLIWGKRNISGIKQWPSLPWELVVRCLDLSTESSWIFISEIHKIHPTLCIFNNMMMMIIINFKEFLIQDSNKCNKLSFKTKSNPISLHRNTHFQTIITKFCYNLIMIQKIMSHLNVNIKLEERAIKRVKLDEKEKKHPHLIKHS